MITKLKNEVNEWYRSKKKPSQKHDGPIVSAQENQKSLQSDYFGEVNELGVWSVRSMGNKFQKLGVNKKFSLKFSH